MTDFIRFDVPEDLEDQIFEAVETARATGELKIGTNEVTKAVERGNVELVIIAEDVDPPEIVMHLPAICDEKNISFAYVESKDELGRASGIDVHSASTAISEPGDAGDMVEEIIDEIKTLKTTE